MRRAFTLVEMMVVMLIVAVLVGIGATSIKRDQVDAQVRGAAESLAAVLRQTRSRAIEEQAAYGVVFNLQNQPGTTGTVLNNWSGGHWYRVIGPHAQGGLNNSRALPLGVRLTNDWNQLTQGNFPDVLAKIAESWVSEPQVLPARQVRFLALSDTDEGPRNTLGAANLWWSGSNIYYGNAGETTYPRPWFGYFDAVARKWYPWGGYLPTKKYSALYYEGKGGVIPDSKNVDDRIYNNDFPYARGLTDRQFKDADLNGDGDTEDLREREVGYAVWRINQPRAVVNADWLDACIMFTPSGHAQFLEWNRNRRVFEDRQANLMSGSLNWDSSGGPFTYCNGARDRAKDCSVGSWMRCLTDVGWVKDNVTAEVVHFEQHNGGFHITLGPDATADSNEFASAADVLRSITPAYRVYVGTMGTIRAYRVQRRDDGYLAGRPVWPPTPATWLQTTAVNQIWRRCRLGYLHVDTKDTTWGNRWWQPELTPKGRPINDIITERMLTDRIWWLDE